MSYLSVYIKHSTIYPNLRSLQFRAWVMLTLTCVTIWSPSFQIWNFFNAKQLKFSLETIPSLQTHQKSEKVLNITWLYRKHKDLASKIIQSVETADCLDSPLTSYNRAYVFSLLAQSHLSDLKWSRNCERLAYPVLAEASSRLSHLCLSFFG